MRSVRSNPTIQSQFNEMKVKIKDAKENSKKGKKVKTDQNELRKEIKMVRNIFLLIFFFQINPNIFLLLEG